MNSPIWLINTSITSYIYLLFVCFFLVRIIKYYSLPRFQLYNTVLQTIITIFYITFSDYIHLIGKSLYFLTKLSLSPYTPTTGNCFSTFCFKELKCKKKFFFFLRVHISMILCIICFSLAYFTYHNSSRSIHFFPYMSRFPSNG